MTKQMIENSDRGITLAKPLAWTILCALLGGGFWMGTQLTETREGVRVLEARQTEDREAIRSNAIQINGLSRSGVRVDERLLSIEQATNRAEQSALRAEVGVQEILRYLRNRQGEPR
jgi:hypothetical protein